MIEITLTAHDNHIKAEVFHTGDLFPALVVKFTDPDTAMEDAEQFRRDMHRCNARIRTTA